MTTSSDSAAFRGDVLRVSAVDALPGPAGTRLAGRGLQRALRGGGQDVGTEVAVAIEARTDPQANLLSLEATPSTPTTVALVGRRVAGGFRAALGDLRSGSVQTRFLRRLLWDLPILAQVAHQTALLDHPAVDGDVRVPTAGADQCSGWRSGGEMLTQMAENDGVLRMALGPTVSGPLLPDEIWAETLEPLAPWSTRRARATAVSFSGDEVEVRLWHRDSYADPDGVERALHQWWVSAALDGDGRLARVTATAGQLPWVECPWAGRSALALDGSRPAEVEHAVAQDFRGIGTCTHLNDTLRTFAELPDLLAGRGQTGDEDVLAS